MIIFRATGIAEPVILGDRNPSDFSVAARMCWASRRETTREEDIAYCLLGIFNVNMPLPVLYGEGSRAFKRLQEEILKQEDSRRTTLF